jgi:hypothetical protein
VIVPICAKHEIEILTVEREGIPRIAVEANDVRLTISFGGDFKCR